jgi:hypothetical protein
MYFGGGAGKAALGSHRQEDLQSHEVHKSGLL